MKTLVEPVIALHGILLALLAASFSTPAAPSQVKPDLDLKPITEKHVMIPMRDGKRLSAYLYLPLGKGPWPVVFEQRYADLRGAPKRAIVCWPGCELGPPMAGTSALGQHRSSMGPFTSGSTASRRRPWSETSSATDDGRCR